jgi:4-amino-4-deoxy-L-arabinose transferase-like glycosyltransferase
MPRWAISGKRLLQPHWLWMLLLGWIVAIACVTLFWGLGDIGLIDETEPLFVEAARQMFRTGDWITPYFDGVTRFDKPPLIYWLMVLCFKVFGVSEWAARLPSAFASLGIVVFCFYVLQHAPSLEATSLTRSNTLQNKAIYRPWLAAWLGATMLMLNLNTYFWGRTGYADMLLTATMGGALLAFFLGYAQSQATAKGRWYGAFYLLIALAILTKGPIALLLPAAIIGGFTLYLGNLRVVLREMQVGWGLLAVLILTLPWYVLVTLANGSAFIQSFFGYHNLTRFSSVVSQHSGPWYFHFLVILAGFLPWSVYLPLALFKVRPWQRHHWQQCSRPEQLSLYAVIWFVVILGFFTVSVTKYFSYTLPLMPAAAILVALLWTGAMDKSEDRPLRRQLSRWFNALLLGGLSWAVFVCPQWLGSDPWMPTLGTELATARLPIMGGSLWAIATILAILCILGRSNALWLVNAIAFLLFTITFLHPAIAITDQVRQQPLREMASHAIHVQKPGEAIVMIGFTKPSLVFYTQQHVEYLEKPDQLPPYLAQAQAPGYLLITTPNLLAEASLKPRTYQELRQAGVYTLVRLCNCSRKGSSNS